MKQSLRLSLLALIFLASIAVVILPAVVYAEESHVWSDDAKIFNFRSDGAGDPFSFTNQLIVDPFVVKEKEVQQYYSIWVKNPLGIKRVEATIKTDTGNYLCFLSLKEGTEKEGRWEGSWSVRDVSKKEIYQTEFTAISKDNKLMPVSCYWYSISSATSAFEWMKFDFEFSGLPSNYVANLAVDSQDDLWLGTLTLFSGENREVISPGGLMKFSGGGIANKIYDKDNSELPNNNVWSISFDQPGNIWVGTDGGLARFNGVNWSTYNTENSGLKSNEVYNVKVDPSGNVWATTINSLVKFDGANWTLYGAENFGGLSSTVIMSLAVDAKGNVWVGTTDGLFRFDGASWTTYDVKNSGLPSAVIVSITVDAKGNVWVGTDGGLAKFDGINWAAFTKNNSGLPNNTIFDIKIDAEGTVWIATLGGLARFDGENWIVYNKENSGLWGDEIRTLAIDKKGNIWVGTLYGGGLTVFREGGVKGVNLNVQPISVKEDANTSPSAFTLSQNYPNPFNPATEISFSLKKESHVALRIFNALGQKVATLVDGNKPAGNYMVKWDAVDLPTGLYFYRLETGNSSQTRKMLLMK